MEAQEFFESIEETLIEQVRDAAMSFESVLVLLAENWRAFLEDHGEPDCLVGMGEYAERLMASAR